MSVRERDRETESERDRERQRDREKGSVEQKLHHHCRLDAVNYLIFKPVFFCLIFSILSTLILRTSDEKIMSGTMKLPGLPFFYCY